MTSSTAKTVFDDMEDDIDFGLDRPAAPLEQIAQQRYATVQKAPEVFRDKCKRCGGSGRWHGAFRSGACFLCDGKGWQECKTSPEQRAHNREKAAERKQRAANEWIAENKPVVEWIKAAETRLDDFAISLSNAIAQYGHLTDGQIAAVYKCIERDAAREEAKRTSPDAPLAQALAAVLPRLSPRDRSFAESMLNGQARYGKFTDGQRPHVERLIASTKVEAPAAQPGMLIPNFHDLMQRMSKFYCGKITIARKNADSLCWIKHDDSAVVIGKIEDGGKVSLFSGRMRAAGLDESDVVPTLAALEANPLEAAKTLGKLSGRCCVCGRDLTNDDSIDAGIGPICAGRLGG